PGLRWSFVALAFGCWIGAAVGLALLRDAPAAELESELVDPLRDRRLLLLCAGSAFYLAGQIAIMGFVVLFLHQERGFSSGAAAGVQQTPLALGGVATPIAFAAVVAATSWRLGFLLVALCPLAGWALLAPLTED